MTIQIRDASTHDLKDIARIYANEVLYGLATFETTPPSADELGLRRQKIVDAGMPYIVAEKDRRILGFAYAGPYRARAAYQNSLENSVYVDSSARKLGVGSQLLEHLIKSCEEGPWRQMIAVIGDSKNTGSVALHKRLGFEHVGTIKAVGYKLDQWVDTVIMQRSLGEGENTSPYKR